MKHPTAVKAARKMCLRCMGNHYKAIRECKDNNCPIWFFRMGKRPALQNSVVGERVLFSEPSSRFGSRIIHPEKDNGLKNQNSTASSGLLKLSLVRKEGLLKKILGGKTK